MAVSNEKLFLLIKEEILAAIDMYKVHHQIATSKSIDNFTGYKINFSSHGNSGIRRAYNLKSFIETLGHSVSAEQVLKKIDEVLEEKSGEKLFSLKTILLCYLLCAFLTLLKKHNCKALLSELSNSNIVKPLILRDLKSKALDLGLYDLFKKPLFFTQQKATLELTSTIKKHTNRNMPLEHRESMKKFSFYYSFLPMIEALNKPAKKTDASSNIELSDLSHIDYWAACPFDDSKMLRALSLTLSQCNIGALRSALPNLKLTAIIMSDLGDDRAKSCYQKVISHIRALENTSQKIETKTARGISRIINFCDVIIGCAKVYLERQKLSPNLFPYIAGIDIYLKYGLNDPFSATKLASGLLASAANPQFSQDFKLLKLSGAMYYGDALRGDGHTNLGLLRAFDVCFFAEMIRRHALMLSFEHFDTIEVMQFKHSVLEFISALFVFIAHSGQKETSFSQYLAIGIASFISHYAAMDELEINSIGLMEQDGSLKLFTDSLFSSKKQQGISKKLASLMHLSQGRGENSLCSSVHSSVANLEE